VGYWPDGCQYGACWHRGEVRSPEIDSPFFLPDAGIIRKVDVRDYYKMPPVGMTETRARIGEMIYHSYTIRCGNEHCWFVGHAPDENGAQTLLDQHNCPTPPARNELPTGLSTIEKLWDEADAVTRAIIETRSWQVGNRHLDGTALNNYALGLSFALSMMTHPHFKTTTDIVRELGLRYKMAEKQIPYRPTPTYRNNPLPAPATSPPGVRTPDMGATRPASVRAARTPGRGTTAKRAAQAVDLSTATPEVRQRIINAVTLMNFTVAEAAAACNVSEQVARIVVDAAAS
jgi:hypothetical protein